MYPGIAYDYFMVFCHRLACARLREPSLCKQQQQQQQQQQQHQQQQQKQ